MKKVSLLFSLIFLFAAMQFSSAQMADWKQQKDFHKVMSETFHPAEKGDLQPIKMRTMEMVAKAQAWKNSEIPSGIADKKAVKKSLKLLVKDSKKLNREIAKGASDSQLTHQLTQLHDLYHTVVGLCKDTEGSAGHDHSDPNHKH